MNADIPVRFPVVAAMTIVVHTITYTLMGIMAACSWSTLDNSVVRSWHAGCGRLRTQW